MEERTVSVLPVILAVSLLDRRSSMLGQLNSAATYYIDTKYPPRSLKPRIQGVRSPAEEEFLMEGSPRQKITLGFNPRLHTGPPIDRIRS